MTGFALWAAQVAGVGHEPAEVGQPAGDGQGAVGSDGGGVDVGGRSAVG